jgi:gas vesicle protein
MMGYLDLLLWAPVFISGIAVGAFAATLVHSIRLGKERRTQLVEARARIIAGIKEEREEEILGEIFQATEALKNEITQSVARFRKAVEPVLAQTRDSAQGCVESSKTLREVRDNPHPSAISL